MDKRKKGTYSNLAVQTVPIVSEEILGLLKNTVLGTEGKLRYRQQEVEKRLNLQKKLEFIQVKKNNRVMATAGVIHRQTNTVESLYVRYLSAYNPFKTGAKKNFNRKISKTGGIREQIGKIFTDHFEKPFMDRSEKACFYAYVESDNIYSQNLSSSFGFKPTRKINTLVFSRFAPKKTNAVKKLSSKQFDYFKTQMCDYYDDHNFVYTEGLENRGKLYAFFKGDEIKAGIRAYPVLWEIVEMPGLTGLLMQKVLPYLPFTTRLFNPKNLHFLAFDSAWHKDGYEHAVPFMMEHICSVHQINMGMFWGDQESDLLRNLANSGKMGLLHTLNKNITADIFIRPINISEADLQELLEKPVFVSAEDMT